MTTNLSILLKKYPQYEKQLGSEQFLYLFEDAEREHSEAFYGDFRDRAIELWILHHAELADRAANGTAGPLSSINARGESYGFATASTAGGDAAQFWNSTSQGQAWWRLTNSLYTGGFGLCVH